MGRANEAIEHIRKALEIDPGNAGAQRNLRDALSRRQ
jgi:tetratricopeptide (TPR) repeat protein